MVLVGCPSETPMGRSGRTGHLARKDRPSGLHASERHARLSTLGKPRRKPPRREVHSHSASRRSSNISPPAPGAPDAGSEAEGLSKRYRHLVLAA